MIPGCPAIFATSVKNPPLHIGSCLICCISPVYRVVPDLLRTILPLLPLEKAAAAKKDRSAAGSQASCAGSAAKQQPQKWDLAATLRQLGECKVLAF